MLNMLDIKIYSASSKSVGENQLITRTYSDRVHLINNNTLSLAKVYNQFIIPENKDYYLIFAHDDLIIEDALLVDKINEAMKTYDVIGLAGIKAPIAIKPPCLWHLMGNKNQYSGAVAHFDKNSEKRFMTSFGITPERVILLDGVFLAINTKRILESGLRFDENNPANFHFYDLNFCLDANNLGLKLGTYPIYCTHKSHGLEKPTNDWINGQNYFLSKYQQKQY